MRWYVALLVMLLIELNICSAAEPRVLTVAQWGKEKILLYLPLYLAMEEGFFREEGVDVRLRYSGNDDQVFASLIADEADLGVGDPVFAAVAREKGFPGKVIALMVQRLGASGYTNESGPRDILRVHDLEGLRVGSFPAPSTTYTLLRKLKVSHGLSTMQIVQSAIGAQLSALAAGRVDIAMDLEPAVSRLEQEGYRVVFSLDEFTRPQAVTGITVTEQVMRRRSDDLQRFVHALQRAQTLLHTNSERSIAVAERLFPQLEKVVVRRAVKRLLERKVFPPTVEIEPVLWKESLDLRHASGELHSAHLDPEVLDNSFAKAARGHDER